MTENTLSTQANHLGIGLGYHDIYGHYHPTSDEVLAELVTLLSTVPPAANAFDRVTVLPRQMPAEFSAPDHLPAETEFTLSGDHDIRLALNVESGFRQASSSALRLPALPDGYYTLNASLPDSSTLWCCLLIVAPPTVYRPPFLSAKQRLNGLTLQLYSLHSDTSWGIGDFSCLSETMRFAGDNGLDFVGINPLHALFSSRPDMASPYSPSSRIWLNPIYLDIEQVSSFQASPKARRWFNGKTVQKRLAALRASETVDYPGVWTLKKEALQKAFEHFDKQKSDDADSDGARFARFVEQKGSQLAGFALFQALDQYFAVPDQLGWIGWPQDYQHPENSAVQQFADEHADEIRFYMWLQWLCAEQLATVNQTAADAGVRLGMYGDLAVGVSRGAADTWLNRQDYSLAASIGAPPDPLGPLGQNWQLPPLHPVVLQQTGLQAFIRLLRENMRLYGILRIDHVMALCRLWWVVWGESAANGAYVRYPLDAMMAVLALESHRHQCVVIGEDLGTVPDNMREALQRYQVSTYSVLYFNRHGAGYTQPEHYPEHSITVTSTHDVAPLAGFWRGQDLLDMAALGVFDGDLSLPEAQAARERDKQDLFAALKQAKCLSENSEMPSEMTPELMHAVHAFGLKSKSWLYAFQIENLLNISHNFNLPGIALGYPNWSRKLPVSVAEFQSQPQVCQQLSSIRKETEMKKTASATPSYPPLDRDEQQTVDSFFFATHGNPFSYLGRHRVNGLGDVIRTLQPDAEKVTVIDRASGKPVIEMTKTDERGFFAAILPPNAPDYALLVQHLGNEAIRIEDAYRFTSGLQDLDAWLLAEGSHLRPYETMGAHLAEVDGVNGVHFRLWAPNARRVSVIGEFNQWDGRRYPMRFHPSSGIWEIFIPEVPFNALYKFELLDANGNVRQKSDPYAFASELRPTTASVVRGLPEKMPEPAFRQQANAIDSPISIYEVHLGSWRRNPENNFWLTYEDLAKELVAYVKDMGFTHIELLPLSEYPFDGSWGYQATGLYAPTSRFGSPQQLQALIQAAHDAGISVILDWVVGHFPVDDHGLNQFDGTPLYEHADPREGYHQDWNTLIYNFGRTEVKNFLQGNALYWIERLGFDGLRVDAVASMVYRDYSRKEGEWIPNQYGGRENLEAINFLRDTNTMLHREVPAASEIAEESTSFANVTRAEGLNFQYKWNMGWMNDTLRYMQEDPVNRKYHHHLMTFGMVYQYTENFILPLSHDEVVHGKGSLLSKMPGDAWQKFANLRAYYGFMYGFPGKKLLFMGCEFAQGREWNYNEPLDWFLLEEEHGGGWHKGMQDFVRDLNHTYRDHAPLYQLDQWPDGFEWLVADDGNNSVFAFERRDRNGNRMIVISNFTPVVRENYRIGVNEAGVYREVMNSDQSQYQGSGVSTGSEVFSEEIFSHGRSHSLNLTLPPLATVYLYWEHSEQE